MAMRRETGVQDDLVATWSEMPRSPGHAFYDRLQALLKEAGFDAFVEDVCKPYYAPRMGAPSLPPGRYFRMHMVGYLLALSPEAAEQGYSDAQYKLGLMYYEGQGVSEDYVEAYKWFSLAAAQGHANAAKIRGFVANEMTPAQIAEAQKLAREWKPKTQ